MTNISARIEGPRIPPADQITTDQLIESFSDWIASVRLQREKGVINQDEENRRIARAMAALYKGRERMKDKAYTDKLTGLGNRRAFDEALGSIAEKDGAVLILDIDKFKGVNDKYGHKAGDRILAQVAFALATSVRQSRETEQENDVVARYGGEEMAVILRNISDAEKVREIAEKIRTSIGASPLVTTVQGEQHQIPITVSIGGGLISPGQNSANIVEAIDKQALYQAKGQGRDQTVMLGDPPREMIQ